MTAILFYHKTIVLSSSAGNHGLDPRMGQPKDLKIVNYCLFAEAAAIRNKSENRLASWRDNLSQWSNKSTCEWNLGRLVGLVRSRHHYLLKKESILAMIRVFEIRRTEGGRFLAGSTEASYLAILLSAKQFFLCVCNGFDEHVPWLLISCLTDCLCNLVLNITFVLVQVSWIANPVSKVIRSRSVL